MKKFFALCLGIVCLFCAVACGEKEQKKSSQNYSEPLYQTYAEEIEKTDLMWDTQTLFETTPQIRTLSDIPSRDGLTFLKFSSAKYQAKTQTWVFAAIGVPTTEKPKDGYPAVVLVHGGGGRVYPEWIEYWTEKGFVAIAFDLFANQIDSEWNKISNSDGGPKENDGPIKDGVENPTDSWVYHSVQNAVLAHNILRARSDVDKTRIAMTGISWGGVITCITSGVDKRFAAFAPIYASGFLYEDSFWLSKGTFGGEKKTEWISLYDPSSYLPYSTKPTLFVSGVNDNCFAVYNRIRSAELVKGKTFFAQRSDLGHGHVWEKTYEVYAFFLHVLYGMDTCTTDLAIESNGNTAVLQYGKKRFEKVNFVYTVSTDEDSHKWEWITVEVSFKNGKYSCEIPEGVTAYLFETFADGDGQGDAFFRQSTEIVLQKG